MLLFRLLFILIWFITVFCTARSGDHSADWSSIAYNNHIKSYLVVVVVVACYFFRTRKNGSISRDLFNSVSATRPKPVGELQRDIEILLMLEVCPKCNTGQLSSQLTCLRFIITTDGVDLNYCIPFLCRESPPIAVVTMLFMKTCCLCFLRSIYLSIYTPMHTTLSGVKNL